MSEAADTAANPRAARGGTAPSAPQRISLVISAMGGQGGGVLASWIAATAERCGHLAQITSVPGVAQRTGATVYYLELFPAAAAAAAGREPVLALMPTPGDVDIVVASELIEAGRAISRGFVDPARTLLIASSHREYTIGERMAMGSGMADAAPVLAAAREAAKRLVCFDMARLAEESGCLISAVLLGALAGAGPLPFPRAAWEETIRESGIAVEGNLAGFAAGDGCARAGEQSGVAETARLAEVQAGTAAGRALIERAGTFAEPVRRIIAEGLRRLADYQDVGYAALYLERLEPFRDLDQGGPAGDHLLSRETARHLALWMAYEDTIRVADLKTRAGRFERVRREVRAQLDQPVAITEFLHPRFEEFCDTLPAGLGRRLAGSAWARRWLGRSFARGRRIRTSGLGGYLLLASIARLRRVRRRTYRYAKEQAEIERWLERIRSTAVRDYALALEVARCQRLLKGYGETHARGLQNFHAVLAALDRIDGSGQAAVTLARLREAALADEQGEKLRVEIARLG